jgi:hypothetical protein
MSSKILALAAGVALATASMGTAGAAIVDISATSPAGADFTFAAGTNYLIQWIGTADGGAFNAWNGGCPGGVCPASGWNDTFTGTIDGDPNLEVFTIQGGPFASALASLAAFQGAANVLHRTLDPSNSFALIGVELTPQPWIVSFDQATTAHLHAGDGSPLDNVGGVSLRITAVPEPGSWALMILGFAAVGAMLRSRRVRPAVA